ncbi:T9SS type A sorting domain-containing protein, partial [Candidatus Dependentiae bacterium]|nr:T9SS type A sorting domain-containing protein [Candidatus Dependentiae bacterium]
DWRLSGYNSKINWYDYPVDKNVVKNTRTQLENNRPQITSNKEAFPNDIVTLNVKTVNLESSDLNKTKIEIILPRYSSYKTGSAYPAPVSITNTGFETRLLFDIDKIYSDTAIDIYLEVQIDSNSGIAGELLQFVSKLYVDTLLINTSAPAELRIISNMPEAPGNIRFIDYKNFTGKLEWDKSVSQNIIENRLYWDSGTGIMNFDAPLSVLSGDSVLYSDSLFFVITNLTDTDYRFVVRAKNNLGVEEKNKDILVVRPIYYKPVELPEIKIASPEKNQAVSGNNYSFIAEASELVEKIFETNKWMPRAHIKNAAKEDPAKKGNPNDYVEFIDAGNQTIVNVYTTEISPFIFLDENFVGIRQNNSGDPNIHNLNYGGIVDSGYLWTATVPLIPNEGHKIYISQRGSRSKNYQNLSLKVEFEIAKAQDNSTDVESEPELYEWQTITSNDLTNFPNPAVSHPWVVTADLSAYPSGAYMTRIKVYYTAADNSETFVVADMQNFDIDHLNWSKKDEKTSDNKAKTTAKLAADDTANITLAGVDEKGNKNKVGVTVAQNILGAETQPANLQLQIQQRSQNDSDVEQALNVLNRELASMPIEINLTTGDSQFNTFANGKTMEIELSYADANNDGVIDGTNIRENEIKLMTYSTTTETWEECEIIENNKEKKTVKAKANHLSFFMLTSTAPSVNAANVIVRPNPFKPNDDIDETGRNYFSGNANSGIIFDNLPANATIKIYTLRGALVTEKSLNNTTSNKYQWDVKNDAGREVASGVYLFVVTSPTGHKTGKFVIVR